MRRRLFPLLLGLLPVLVLADVAGVHLARVLSLPAHAAVWGALALATGLAARAYGRRAALAGAAGYALVGALLVAVPHREAKAFYRAVDRIRPGMDRAEVARCLSDRAGPDDWIGPFDSDREVWWSRPFFASCDVRYDGAGRVAEVSTYAVDPPPSSIPWAFGPSRGGQVVVLP